MSWSLFFDLDDLIGQTVTVKVPVMIDAELTDDGAFVITSLDEVKPR